MPGIQLSLDALNIAELLPSVRNEKPLEPLGKNTRDCMTSGVIFGQAMAVREFIRLYSAELSLPADVPVVITGEYADTVEPYLGIRTERSPELTLRGLRAIFDINRGVKSPKTR